MARKKDKKKKDRERRVAQKKLAAQKKARELASKAEQDGSPRTGTIARGVAAQPKPSASPATGQSPFIHRRMGG